jgi:hypothetical protein
MFICDAPARAFLQCVKGHTSYEGCAYCRIVGVRENNRVVFLDRCQAPRTGESYSLMAESNQLCLSPLASLVNINQDFPPEYMHSVCLGVVRKIFKAFIMPSKGMRLACKLSVTQQLSLSNLMTSIAKYTPHEFQRRPRSLKEFPHYKASEFRMLLLYLGPFLLKNFLPQQYYNHFLLLHFAIYVFVSDRLKHLYANAARCIEIFVNDMPGLYGKQSVSYNVHVILHLHESVLLHGSLDNFSAFPYENFLSLLKRRMKPTRFAFQQSLSQLINIRSLYTGPTDSQLKFSHKSPNNCAMLPDNTFVIICSFDTSTACITSAQKLIFSRSLYSLPYDSCVLSIGYYTLSRSLVHNVYPVSKAICIPCDSEFLIIPYASG